MLSFDPRLGGSSFPGQLISYVRTVKKSAPAPADVEQTPDKPKWDDARLHDGQFKTARKVAEHVASLLEATPDL